MPTDQEIQALESDLHDLSLALRASNNLCDVLAIQLSILDRWFSFFHDVDSIISTLQVERLLDIQIAHGHRAGPRLHALLNRPGITPGFSRGFFGRLRPEVRKLPRTLRQGIANLPDRSLRLAVYTTALLTIAIIGVTAVDCFSMSDADAASILQMSLPRIAVKHPEVLTLLTVKIRNHLTAASAPQLWFSRSHPLFKDFPSPPEATIIDIGRACGQRRLDLLKALAQATEERSAAAVGDAIKLLKLEGDFFATTKVTKMPAGDFERFDGTLTFATILRSARKSNILYDHGEYAILQTSEAVSHRFFIRFPSFPAAFIEEETEQLAADYLAAPLKFAIKHSAERLRSANLLSMRTEIDILEGFRREISMAHAAAFVSQRLNNLARSGLSSIPEAAFTATAYLLVARQLGIQDATTIAALEGFVHILLRSLSNRRR